MALLVLVIDDDPRVRSVVRRQMERAGFDVAEAADGREGLKICRREAPAAVLTDLYMPECEGLETIGRLRREFPQLPIIAMSGGFGRLGDQLEVARRLGAALTLAKPFSAEQLTGALLKVLAPPASLVHMGVT
jgi:CheY-like chemotaxis protein